MELRANAGTYLRNLCPHFLHILEHHVAVPIERLDSAQQLLVIPAVDQHLHSVVYRWKNVSAALAVRTGALGTTGASSAGRDRAASTDLRVFLD